MHRFRTFLFLLLAAAPVAAADDTDLLERIRATSRSAVANPGAAGLSVAVARGDEILLAEGFGLADVENRVPVTPDSVFRIGSVTKQFTAAAIIRLAEDGELSLADELSDHYPFDTQGKSVTIHQLLNHTSGIKSYTGLGPEWQKTIRLDLSHEELLDLVEDEPFDFEPGTDWAYNNTGYYLLGVVIEEILAESYGDTLEEMIFEPLGMDSTRVGSAEQIIPHRARGYESGGSALKNAEYISMNQPGAAGALLSTASDLVLWQRGLVTGKVVEPESYERMIRTEELPGGRNPQYGYGLMVGDLEGRARIGHGGGINGFSSHLAYYPEEEITVVVLANSTLTPVGAVERQIARIVLGLDQK